VIGPAHPGRLIPGIYLFGGGYAENPKLHDNGVSATCRTEEEMIHGFLDFYNSASTPALSHRVEPILQHAADAIRKAFTTSD
jgi:hypothetical protein